MNMNMIKQNISRTIEEYGFTGDIIVNLLYETNMEKEYYHGVYYFIYEDEIYHIIVVYIDDRLYISLNNEIAKTIVG